MLTVGVVRDGAMELISRVGCRYDSPDSTNVLGGQLVFAPGERRQVIVVPILDDGDTSGGRRGTLFLEAPEGSQSLQIWINDNEFVRTLGEFGSITALAM